MTIKEWLESPEGEAWSKRVHKLDTIVLVTVKDDLDKDIRKMPILWYA